MLSPPYTPQVSAELRPFLIPSRQKQHGSLLLIFIAVALVFPALVKSPWNYVFLAATGVVASFLTRHLVPLNLSQGLAHKLLLKLQATPNCHAMAEMRSMLKNIRQDQMDEVEFWLLEQSEGAANKLWVTPWHSLCLLSLVYQSKNEGASLVSGWTHIGSGGTNKPKRQVFGSKAEAEAAMRPLIQEKLESGYRHVA